MVSENPVTTSDEIRTLLLEKDWSAHPLGPYEDWSPVLRRALSIMLESKFPIIASEARGENIRVSVSDKGIGLSDSDLERVFDRFYRSEGKNQATFPGFGIGLFIAADIINRHQGQIGVESTLGEGSTFFFELPISKKT